MTTSLAEAFDVTKTRARGLICMVSLTLLASFAATALGDAPSVEVIETKVIAARRAIVCGEVVIELEIRRGPEKGSAKAFEHSRHLYFDGVKTRCDLLKPATVGGPESRVRVRRVECFSETRHVYFCDEVISPRGDMVVLNDFDLGVEKSGPVVDPRMLGLVSSDVAGLVNWEMDSFIGRPDRDQSSVVADTRGEVPCWKVSYRLRRGPWVRYWVDRDHDLNVLRLEVEYPVHGKPWIDSVETQYQQLEGLVRWFPLTCRYRHAEDGTVTRAEDATVRVVGLNRPVDPAAFTLAGMGVPVGMGVVQLPNELGDSRYWDGSKVVSLPDDTTIQSAIAADVRRRIVLIVVAVVAAALVAFVGWRLLLPGDQSSPKPG